MSESRIELLDGKYTVIHNNGVGFQALRHGEPWRSLTGDGLVFAMAQEIERLRLVETDRDIKAANLKSLVDMVLDYDDLDGHEDVPAEKYILQYNKMVELARGLK